MAPHSSTLAWKIPGAWWATVRGVAKNWTQLRDFTFTFHFDALEEEMATHSSVLAWRIPLWAAVYGVAQSRTWLKRLSSSSRLTLTANVAWVTINVRLHHSLCQKLKQEAKPPFPHKSALGMLCSPSSIFHALTQGRGKCLISESVTVRCKAPTSLSLGSDWSAMW